MVSQNADDRHATTALVPGANAEAEYKSRGVNWVCHSTLSQ